MTDRTTAPKSNTLGYEQNKAAPPRPPVVAPRVATTLAHERQQRPVALQGATVASAAPLANASAAVSVDLDVTMAAESNPALSAPAHRYGHDALAATQAFEPSANIATSSVDAAVSRPGRSTVLPRVITSETGPTWGVDSRPRYETLKALGEGGMGEVALVKDHDIERTVALKKLRTEVQGTTALLRFAEEIKIIGQLEHPNIIPIHDVGIDEKGQHYFVMKYVNGETLESIIDKLRAGDPAMVARFPYEARTQLFLAILQALRYAHAQGIIHRDIKPANIMVGPFGEVTVMDWGLAKKIRNDDGTRVSEVGDRPGDGANSAAGLDAGASTDRKKLVETQHGALLGTPLYMSPEQAAGNIAQLDERSDIYSLGVLFHELLTLEHYLADRESVSDVIMTIVENKPIPALAVTTIGAKGVPAELAWFLNRTLEKDPAKRFQSIDEMVQRIEGIANGEIVAQCPVTGFKRYSRLFLKWVDAHQMLFLVLMSTSAIAMLFALVAAIVAVVRMLA